MKTVDEIIAETREKYTVHNCSQCEFRKSCNDKFDSEKCKGMRQSIMLGFGIEDGYFTKLLDSLEAAHKREMADALDTGAFVEAAHNRKVDVSKAETTTDKNSVVGNGAKCREALLAVHALLGAYVRYEITAESLCLRAKEAINEALAEPPRNCDVMSLETARKVWFMKEIIPRINGVLPLGEEVPFEKWFVSQYEQGGAE